MSVDIKGSLQSDAQGGTIWYYRTIKTPILGIGAGGFGFMYNGGSVSSASLRFAGS